MKTALPLVRESLLARILAGIHSRFPEVTAA